MLKLHKTSLNDVILIEPPTNFEDFRGSYVEIYNQRMYNEAGIRQEFIQDDISMSRKYVLRGIHGDLKTWKLVSCLQGSFYIIVINNDPNSTQYRKWEGFTLSESKRQQILIPPKFGNGHLVMTETAIFHYKQTSEYNRNGQFTISWNDPEFNFWWPVTHPLVSFRDKGIE